MLQFYSDAASYVLYLNRQQRKFTAQHNNVISRNNASPLSVLNNQNQALTVVVYREINRHLMLSVVAKRNRFLVLLVVAKRNTHLVSEKFKHINP
jgi:hypothetical protein